MKMYITVARSADTCGSQANVYHFNLQIMKYFIFNTTIILKIEKKAVIL